MTQNNNDYCSQQSDNNPLQQTLQNSSSPDDKLYITVEDPEEREVKITGERRPQFRASENYRRWYCFDVGESPAED